MGVGFPNRKSIEERGQPQERMGTWGEKKINTAHTEIIQTQNPGC